MIPFLDALRALAKNVSTGGKAPVWCPVCNARAKIEKREAICTCCSRRWTPNELDFAPARCPAIPMRLVDGICPVCKGRGQVLHGGWIWHPCTACRTTGIDHCECDKRAIVDLGNAYGGLHCADCLADQLEDAAGRARWRYAVFGDAEAAE